MRRSFLNHLQYSIKYTNGGSEWFVFAFVESSLTIEMPE
jgi:hypothetical protein